ncbi:MAG: cellulose biosynthesis cyclic di-GMP-binding regulatory protein BcsB, partial [Methylobacteriaceae bacterium]|nr:cellulose biosynthesis cyclic di-GMP-binding regulatory protein BcsB [Methylobacteriaceae bacterium]
LRSRHLISSLVAAVAVALGATAHAEDAPSESGRPAVAAPAFASQRSARLLRIGADARQLRFEGETVSKAWPMFVTVAQAKTHARMRLAYTNAVSVMAEASKLTLSINDVTVAETQIAAPNGPGVLNVDLPSGLLEPGYNALRISVQQRHKVDCSIGATYELWTQVDPAATGLIFPDAGDIQAAELDDLRAISPDEAGATPIRAVLPPDAGPSSVERTLRAVGRLALRGGFVRPVVDVATEPGTQPGLAVIVGTTEELRKARRDLTIAENEPVVVKPGSAPGQIEVVVAGQTDADVDRAIESLWSPASPQQVGGTPAGMEALVAAGGYRVNAASTIRLRDLGVHSEEFTGRLFRTTFDIVMPPDFFSAEYGKASLRVDAGYAQGLDPRSQILVRVNDRDAASLSLPNRGGDIFRKRTIAMSLADLRPGFNEVEIEAQVGAPADAACDPLAAVAAPKRFVFLEQSELVIPPVARMARMPSLSATTASGFPYLDRVTPAKLFVPHPDSATIGAAATFLARAAVVSGAPVDVPLSFSSPGMESGSAIIVGAFNDLAQPVVEAAGLDYLATRQVWPKILPKAGEGIGKSVPARTGMPPRDEDLYKQWSQNVGSGFLGEVSGLFDRIVGSKGAGLRFWKQEDDKFAPSAGDRIVVAQNAAPSGGGRTWTLITAPSEESLSAAMREIVAPSLWNRLGGRIAAYDPATGALTSIPVEGGYFVETAPLTIGNLRLVAAGWLSSNLGLYVLGFMLVCLALGLATAAVVRRYGARS